MPGRSGLDKGTLAAAHIGLRGAGQGPPDRRTAYGPPPLIKSAAPCLRECRKPVVRARENGGTPTTRVKASAVNDGGRPAPGASARAAPCWAGALRARRADAWRPSPLPWAGGDPPLRTDRHRPSRVKQRLTGRCRQSAQQWTAVAPGHGGLKQARSGGQAKGQARNTRGEHHRTGRHPHRLRIHKRARLPKAAATYRPGHSYRGRKKVADSKEDTKKF